jgi:hypothetical protein
VTHARRVASERHDRTVFEIEVEGRLRFHLDPEGDALLHRSLVEELVSAVKADGDVESRLRTANPGNVVEVRVGQKDVLETQLALTAQVQELVHLVAWIDEDGLASFGTPHDEAVLFDGWDRPDLDNHR